MNFLAHCALANDAAEALNIDEASRQGLLAGAVIGDFIKGPVRQDWPVPLQAGVRLHRKIDAISNQNQDLRRLSATFPKHIRRFAPIFLDLLSDYSLARQWHSMYTHTTSELSQQSYLAIAAYAQFLPEHGQHFFDYMRKEDLLANYHQWPHIERGTHSVLRRLHKRELFHDADQAMRAAVTATDQAVGTIMHSLRSSCENWSPFNATPPL